MKSAALDYVRPESPQHAFSLLAQHGDDARILADGQTLLATLNMRLSQAALHIAHRAIRNMGTLGGTLVLANAQSERRVAAADFFHGLYATALRDGELLVACELLIIKPGERQHFSELARRHGDYAIASSVAACTWPTTPRAANCKPSPT